MISTLTLQNYRGFKDFQIDGLKRVNLLVGKNNCGKTSILEALEIAGSAHRPRTLLDIASRRGESGLVSQDGLSHSGEDSVDISHFFNGHRFVANSSLSIQTNDSSFGVAWVVREFDESAGQNEFEASVMQSPTQYVLEISCKDTAGRGPYRLPLRDDAALMVQQVRRIKARVANHSDFLEESRPIHYVGTDSLGSSELSKMWNQVLIEAKESEVIAAMKILDPEIESVMFLLATKTGYESNSDGVIVSMRGQEQRVPLGSLGDGMRRMLTLAVSLSQSRNGLLLVDEIDTGLHYTVLAKMWRFIIENASAFNTQVFATTHSSDCIEGLARAVETYPELGKEVSLQKIHSSLAHAVALDGDDVTVVSRRGIEVR